MIVCTIWYILHTPCNTSLVPCRLFWSKFQPKSRPSVRLMGTKWNLELGSCHTDGAWSCPGLPNRALWEANAGCCTMSASFNLRVKRLLQEECVQTLSFLLCFLNSHWHGCLPCTHMQHGTVASNPADQCNMCSYLSLCDFNHMCKPLLALWVTVNHNACLGNASPLALIWQCHNYLEGVHQVKSLTLAYYIWLTTNLILALWVLVWDGCHVLEAKFCHWRQDLHTTRSSTILSLVAGMAHSSSASHFSWFQCSEMHMYVCIVLFCISICIWICILRCII